MGGGSVVRVPRCAAAGASGLSGPMLLVLLGCVAPMSGFHTGATVPYRRFEVVGGAGIHVDSNFIGSTVQTGELVADEAGQALDEDELPTLDDAEKTTLAKTVLAYSLAMPTPVEEIGLRYGITRRAEVGAKWTSSGLAAHGKVQLHGPRLDPADRFDVALGLQVQRQVWDLPIPGALAKTVDIDEFSRTDFIVPLAMSRQWGDIGWVHGGPKVYHSRIDASLVERLTDLAGQQADVSGGLWGAGLTWGGGVGYRYVFLVAEMNVQAYSFRPTFLGEEVRFRGVDFYPAIGLRGVLYDPRKVGQKPKDQPRAAR